MHAADGRVCGRKFLQSERIHGARMHSSIPHGEVPAELEIVLDEAAFLARTVNADDAGSRGGEKERGQVMDEAHADVVAKGDGVFETIFVFCNGELIISREIFS